MKLPPCFLMCRKCHGTTYVFTAVDINNAINGITEKMTGKKCTACNNKGYITLE